MERNPLSDTVGHKTKRFTVRELIEHLKQYDPGMQVVYDLYSDTVFMELSDIAVVQGVENKNDDWVKVVGSVWGNKPSEEELKMVKGYLRFPGN